MKIRLTLLNIENEKIGEMACGFAKRMNGVDSAELDGETLTLTLSPSGSENVVKSAVTGYIMSLDNGAVITEGDETPKKEYKTPAESLRLEQIAVSALLVAVGVFIANDTAALFTFIAAYIIIGWDVISAVGSKGKTGAQIVGIAAAVVSLVLFLIGLYPAGAAIMILYKILILIFTNKKKKERSRNTDNS